MNQAAIRIAQKIVEKSHETGDAYDVQELYDSGVQGQLFREVMEILYKWNLVADLTASEAYTELINKNIKKCKSLLRQQESPHIRAELELLQNKPQILIGKYNAPMRKTEADTGTPLMINHYESSATALLHLDSVEKKNVILVDGEIYSFDASDLDARNPN